MTNEIKNIPNFLAVDLAHAYHEVMTMTNRRSSLPCSKGARETLEDYLALCEKVGTRLHNDVWLKNAYDLVDQIEESHRQVMRKARANIANHRKVSA